MPLEIKMFGPYKRGDSYRCIVEVDGQRQTLPNQPTENRARKMAEHYIGMMQAQAPVSIQEGLDRYREHLTLTNSPAAIATSLYRLKSFFPDPRGLIKSLTPAKCQAQYLALVKRQKPDTHRNALAVAKGFGGWLVAQRLIRHNPFAEIKPIGARSRGKEQLTNDETKRWSDVALREAIAGQDGALAAYMTLIMGLRPGEVVVRTVRDVDDGGTRLRVRQAKTRAGDRDVKITEVLQPLIAARCRGKGPDDLLFPAEDEEGKARPHPVGWVRDHVRRVCRLAGVQQVCAHSMRGKHADLSVGAGMSPDAVADSIGHTSSRVTMAHYAKRETLADVQRDRAAERLGLAGGMGHLRVVR